jgi:hypothetical protein
MMSASAMLRKAFGNSSDTLSTSEEAALTRLSGAHQRLLTEEGRLDMKSEAGYHACSQFLDALDVSARALKLDAAPRTYRAEFTINYRTLFPDEARNYRVDVLEASAEQYAVIWVNGDKFEFSAEAMRRAETLQRAWTELKMHLNRWNMSAEHPRMHVKPTRSELQSTLLAVDYAWASFEHKYITELIAIEEKARQLIVDAIKHEQALQQMEKDPCETKVTHQPKYREEVSRLVKCIARLNARANVRRKGRDDLGVEILFGAQTTLQRCDDAEQGGDGTETLSAARILATDVVDSFAAMRQYLKEVDKCLERVDPHLCNNVGLVTRLVDWEESWEVGARYVQHEPLLGAVCDVVTQVRAAQRLAPALVDMCNDCDVELFLVLPRIIWLRFLVEPVTQTELLKSLLPHRFPEIKDSAGEKSVRVWDAELASFIEKFQKVERIFNAGGGRSSPHPSAWKSLVKRVVSGESGDNTYGNVSPRTRLEAQPAMEDLMRDLEWYSIELQRHCPEDWNQCSAILVQCLTGDATESKREPFRV